MIKVNEEIKKAQTILDKIVPNKVKVKAKYDSERRCHILIGEYDDYMQFDGKVYSSKYEWIESMDRFYSDCKLFVAFFKQRAKYMNASKEEQIAFEGHPETF
jgi:hypothetical protein|tara:strand:- start:406 stop:711 length:306 start_codon:yes stop_codon:yes gene_type:complete